MSETTPQPPTPDRPDVWTDPRITAFVLGELEPEEARSFQKEIDENADLAEAVQQARRVQEQLESFYQSASPMRLATERREAILGTKEKGTPAGEAVDVGTSSRQWKLPAIAASTVFLIVGISASSLWMSRSDSLHLSMNSEAIEQSAPDSAPMDTFAEASREKNQLDPPRVPAAGSTQDFAMDRELGAEKPVDRSEFQQDAVVGQPLNRALRRDLGSSTPVEINRSGDKLAEANEDVRVQTLPRSRRLPREPAPASRLEASRSGEAPASASWSAEPAAGPVPEESDAVADIEGLSLPSRPRGGSASRQLMEAGKADDRPFIFPTDWKQLRLRRKIIPPDEGIGPGMGGDQFDPIVENDFRRVREHPRSTFSIDVDTASYSKVRDFLMGAGRLPRPDAVRIEELVNYFDYNYAGPAADSPEPFAAAMDVASCPWNDQHRLVRVGIQAERVERDQRPPCNLVFLIDTSGSMNSPRKLPLVVEGLKLLLDELRPQDRVALVTYAGSAGLVLDSTPVSRRAEILRGLAKLRAGGSTNGGAGLQLAYDTAREHRFENGVNRVVLCSDGDFNVGMTGTDQMVEEAKRQAKAGIELTVLGFGMGNHNDAMMEQISQRGAGNYAYVDSIAEARKVLVDDVAGTLVTVAKDVKIQIEFNPTVVSAYRLIGYENRLMAKEDFNDDRKDAGEIGAGHRVTAFYEIVPSDKLPDQIAPAVDPLKYQPNSEGEASAEGTAQAESARPGDGGPSRTVDESDAGDQVGDAPIGKNAVDEILTLKLRYKPPQGDTSKRIDIPLKDQSQRFEDAGDDFRFGAAVAGFGMLLRNSTHSGNWTYDDVLRAARGAGGEDGSELRKEFVQMVQTARAITQSESDDQR